MSGPDIIGGKVDIVAITPGITPEQPILITLAFEYRGKRMMTVKGLTFDQADALESQLRWSIMDWQMGANPPDGGKVQ